MDLLDPNNPLTHRNWPAPDDHPVRLDKELADIAGRRPCGCPNVRMVWGQTRRAFRRDKMRLLYVDERIPAVETERHTLKKLLFVEKVKEYVSTDPDGTMHFIEIDHPHHDVRYFSKLEDVPTVIEPGWFYEQEPPALEFIGEQLWWLEQWKPGNRIAGGRSEWDEVRWEIWHDPELDKDVLCDTIGPFPSNGRYETIGVVGESYLYPEHYEEEAFAIDHRSKCVNRYKPVNNRSLEDCPLGGCPAVSLGMVSKVRAKQHYRYRAPAQDTIEVVRENWHRREHQGHVTKEQAGKDRFYHYRQTVEANRVKTLEERRARMAGDQWKFKSPDRGYLGVEGGGSRIYTDHVNFGQQATPNRKARRAAKAQQRRAA